MLPLELCKRGHPRIPENLKANRSCKLCERDAEKARRARTRELRGPETPRTHCANGHPENRDSRGACKACKNIAKKKYWKAHPEKKAAWNKLYYERHPEAVLKRREASRAYAKAHPEKIKAYSKAHPRKPRTSEQAARRFAKRRARKAGNGGSYTKQEEKDLRNFYDNRCVCCWRTKEELAAAGLRIVLDHVVSISKGGTSFISNLQPLCHNAKKGVSGCNEYKCDFHDTDYRLEGLLGVS